MRSAKITSLEMVPMTVKGTMFSHWLSMSISIDDQILQGCFFNFNDNQIWVATDNACRNKPCAYNQPGLNLPNIEGTEKERIDYGISGLITSGKLEIGGLIVDDIQYLAVSKSSINWACNIGFGQSTNQNVGLISKLKELKVLDSNIISIFQFEGHNGGRVDIGGVDDNRFNNQFKWIKSNGWDIILSGIKFDSVAIPMPNELNITFFAVFNDYTFLPLQIAEEINRKYLNLTKFDKKYHNAISWGFECDQIPKLADMELAFGKVNILITPLQYFFTATLDDGKQYCVSSIFGIPETDSQLQPSLGLILLRSYYLAFDFEFGSVGFTIARRQVDITPSLIPLRPTNTDATNTFPTWILFFQALILVFLAILIYIWYRTFRKKDTQRKLQDQVVDNPERNSAPLDQEPNSFSVDSETLKQDHEETKKKYINTIESSNLNSVIEVRQKSTSKNENHDRNFLIATGEYRLVSPFHYGATPKSGSSSPASINYISETIDYSSSPSSKMDETSVEKEKYE